MNAPKDRPSQQGQQSGKPAKGSSKDTSKQRPAGQDAFKHPPRKRDHAEGRLTVMPDGTDDEVTDAVPYRFGLTLEVGANQSGKHQPPPVSKCVQSSPIPSFISEGPPPPKKGTDRLPATKPALTKTKDDAKPGTSKDQQWPNFSKSLHPTNVRITGSFSFALPDFGIFQQGLQQPNPTFGHRPMDAIAAGNTRDFLLL